MFVITSIIWKPLVFLSLEFCPIELWTLLCPEIVGTFWAALFGWENVCTGPLWKGEQLSVQQKSFYLLLFPYKIRGINSICFWRYCWWTAFTSDTRERETNNDILLLKNNDVCLGKRSNRQPNPKNRALYLNIAWPIASCWSNTTGSTFCPERQKNYMKFSEEYTHTKIISW